jgi:opacity protein-like surface antigen
MRSLSTLGAIAALLMASHSVGAATLESKGTFTGFQIGAALAYNSTKGKYTAEPQENLKNAKLVPTGIGAGVFLSYLYALGTGPSCPVAGLDGGYIHSWAKDDIQFKYNANEHAVAGPVQPNLQEVNFELKEKSTWFVAPRFGIAMGNVMPYIRVGFAQAKYSSQWKQPDQGSPYSNFADMETEVEDPANVYVPSGVAATGTLGTITTRGLDKTDAEKEPLKETVGNNNITANGPMFGLGADILVTPKMSVNFSGNFFLFGEKKLKYNDKFNLNKWNVMLTVAYKI